MRLRRKMSEKQKFYDLYFDLALRIECAYRHYDNQGTCRTGPSRIWRKALSVFGKSEQQRALLHMVCNSVTLKGDYNVSY